MMQGFEGFSIKGRLIKVPGQFFSELLPQIDSLPELKVTLYCFWQLQQKEGQVRFLRKFDLLADEMFMSGMAPRESDRQAALEEGLERAVIRGTLLHVQLHGDKADDDLYFVNTARGRAAVEGIEKGEWMPGPEPVVPPKLTVERPNVFTIYEQNIGPLTPHIADSLRDFEQTYPEEWIVEAIEIAVKQNKRNLAYCEAILKRWQVEGRGEDDRHLDDAQRFISGKYKDEIEY
jgi:DNA replication protein